MTLAFGTQYSQQYSKQSHAIHRLALRAYIPTKRSALLMTSSCTWKPFMQGSKNTSQDLSCTLGTRSRLTNLAFPAQLENIPFCYQVTIKICSWFHRRLLCNTSYHNARVEHISQTLDGQTSPAGLPPFLNSAFQPQTPSEYYKTRSNLCASILQDDYRIYLWTLKTALLHCLQMRALQTATVCIQKSGLLPGW